MYNFFERFTLMKEIIVTKANHGQKVEKFVRKYLEDAPLSFIYKLFRIKDIKVNGKRVTKDYILQENDLLQIYVTDKQLEEFSKKRLVVKTSVKLNVIYEDNNILIVNKPSGILIHGDAKEKRITLTNVVLNYLHEKNEFNPDDHQFVPAPCHRLDRNTSGLVIFAKNIISLQLLEELFKTKEQIKKEYIALVCGKLYGENKIDAPLYKNEETKTVSVKSIENGGKKALTYYKAIETFSDCSLLNVRIVTGRTHQIRVHLAYISHPILGDNKYGNFSVNKMFLEKYHYQNQFLHAYKIEFNNLSGVLSYLSNKSFEAPLPEVEQKILEQIKKDNHL